MILCDENNEDTLMLSTNTDIEDIEGIIGTGSENMNEEGESGDSRQISIEI